MKIPHVVFGFSFLYRVTEEQWNCKTQESLTFPLTSKMSLQAESELTEEIAQKGHKDLGGALTLGGSQMPHANIRWHLQSTYPV